MMPTQLCSLRVAIAGVGAGGDLAVLGESPEGAVVVTAKGAAVVTSDLIRLTDAPGPYDDLAEALQAQASGRFTLRPFRPEDLLRDLVRQLDGIGIPDWAGAEGLCLEAARAFLQGPEPASLREARKDARERNRIGWDDQEFPYSEWQHEVARGDTRVGYVEFVLRNRESVETVG